MIQDYSDVNRGLKRKINKAWRDGLETIELNVQFLRDVSHALDELVKASKRRGVQEGAAWRIKPPLTNYDRLISKTPEEMAEWIEDIAPHKRFAFFLNWKTWLDWLKQEATDEK